MTSPLRREKLSTLFREELSKIIDRELDFPGQNLVTVTKVVISEDNHYATVFVSILGREPEESLELIKKNVYAIQQILNRRVRMRPVPRISFAFDREEFKREIVEKALAKLKKQKEL